jgi:alpha-tubulin suppressor-like RCC1 family protein
LRRVDVKAPLRSYQSGVEQTCALTQKNEIACLRGAGPAGEFTALSVGYYHSCALNAARDAFCWGDASDGRLGFPLTTSSPAKPGDLQPPGKVAGDRKWRAISAGYAHTCALDEKGAAYCWGRDTDGELGGGNERADCWKLPRTATGPCVVVEPAAVTGPIPFRAISAGMNLTCGVAVDGKVFCWGTNLRCELGTCQFRSMPIPMQIALPERAARIFTGYGYACALSVFGRAFCWGGNYHGQLGNPAADQASCGRAGRCSPKPVEVAGSHLWRQLATGEMHVCGITLDDDVFCWGSREDGRLGENAGTEVCKIPRPEGFDDAPCSSTPVRILSVRAN